MIDASLKRLFDALSTLEFEEYGVFGLTGVSWVDDENVALRFVLRQQDRSDELWELRCGDVRRVRISNDRWGDHLRIETRHPLLLPYSEPKAELYFSQRPEDAGGVIGRLIEAHREVVGAWFDCLEFLNIGPDGSLRRMLEGGFGRLAQGPRSLIERYARVLEGAGVPTSVLPPRAAHDAGQSDEAGTLVALIFGASHVVAAAVTGDRL
jgi:hypothetical protein